MTASDGCGCPWMCHPAPRGRGRLVIIGMGTCLNPPADGDTVCEECRALEDAPCHCMGILMWREMWASLAHLI